MTQSFAMMALGYFVFSLKTIAPQDISRDMSWNHVANNVVGTMPKFQFTGKADETIKFNATLYPEVTGGTLSLTTLELMAEQGNPYPLISGSTFVVLGWFVITKISEQKSVFFADGTPLRIDFTLELQRIDASILTDIVDEVISLI
ncbi:phage tail protein [Actinobacillus equuli subsp. haemolyticus]|uniref:Phage tail protein n=1 Tax=Actinobacillus equuli subsp. equuli TaxID=202947 RepID=A0A9X4JCA9_ACTEU|nr:phage tail protein [Actinobacillus equuli]MDE8034632.1 phage tail protein [Actinobacillus equuli subsp. equuli]MDG4948732.1 phage tail protein [Actinobacillus equuli subsp. haemolyticus]WGE63777.1 phage tail protein [Actinobacillus equuli subsp. haemolyticus]